MTTRIWLVRHGQPHEDGLGRFCGRTDIGLSARGRREAAEAAMALRDEAVSMIYASPRLRTRETAWAIAGFHRAPVRVARELGEIDFGDFEGRRYVEVAVAEPEAYWRWMEKPTEMEFPNGESFAGMRRRVEHCYSELVERHRGETIVVVAHGAVNRVVLGWALGLPDENIFRIAQGYAARNLIRHVGEYPQVELMNIC